MYLFQFLIPGSPSLLPLTCRPGLSLLALGVPAAPFPSAVHSERPTAFDSFVALTLFNIAVNGPKVTPSTYIVVAQLVRGSGRG